MQITTEAIQTQIPYYLTQEAKEGIVKALKSFPRKIDYYINRYPGDLLQGDGWTSLELIRFGDGERKSVKGILISNSCDITPDNKRELPSKINFVPIIKLHRYMELLAAAGLENNRVESKVTAIKEQNVTTLFYLPKGAGLDDDYIARLDDMHTIPTHFFQAIQTRKKLFTLSQVGFYLFLLKLSIHFCRFHEEIARSPSPA